MIQAGQSSDGTERARTQEKNTRGDDAKKMNSERKKTQGTGTRDKKEKHDTLSRGIKLRKRSAGEGDDRTEDQITDIKFFLDFHNKTKNQLRALFEETRNSTMLCVDPKKKEAELLRNSRANKPSGFRLIVTP